MNETLSGAVAALRGTADVFGEAGQRLTTVDPGASAFGAGGPGRLGEVGRDLYFQWQRAVDARAREAQAHASRIYELAGLVERVAGGLTEANDSARSRPAEADDGHTPGVT
jgi:hypothetical protein